LVDFDNKAPFVFIGGPCQLESKQHAMDSFGFLQELTTKLDIPFVYKTSFDKANRSTHDSKRGMGFWHSLDVFSALRQAGAYLLTDVHENNQAIVIAKYVDIIQIPAFLARQTDLILTAGRTGNIINVKKGQFMSPYEMKNVVKKIESTDNTKVLLTERGTTFGYGDLVVDMRSLHIMKDTNKPVIFDASHSVQKPAGLGHASGGERRFIAPLAKAAVAIGVAGVFIETHEDPERAPSDGPNMVHHVNLRALLEQLKEIDQVVKRT
jgi:2-dehydro-3-deoxyphosphooctonate aldolase (KDO 8-P synthase)